MSSAQYPSPAPQGNPFANPQGKGRTLVRTVPLIVNGQQVQLPGEIQPVYVVSVPVEQIAAGVMRGIVYATLFLIPIMFIVGMLLGALLNA